MPLKQVTAYRTHAFTKSVTFVQVALHTGAIYAYLNVRPICHIDAIGDSIFAASLVAKYSLLPGVFNDKKPHTTAHVK